MRSEDILKQRLVPFLSAIAAATLLTSGAALAVAGDLDHSCDSDGRVTLEGGEFAGLVWGPFPRVRSILT
jgi:hypothetical protein